MRYAPRYMPDSGSIKVLAAMAICAQLGFPAAGSAQDVQQDQMTQAQTPGADDAQPKNNMNLSQQDVSQHPHAATTPADYISMDERYLLVLERFTNGPRPGDLGRLRAMGLNGWFQQQLNPARMDDSALDKRLASYPAMNLPLGKLMELYPTNQMIRQSLNGRVGVPSGDAAKAIYADQQAQYKNIQQKKKNGDTGADDAGIALNAAPLPQTPNDILSMVPDKRFKALCRLTLPQLRQLRQSMSQEQRLQLTAGMTPEQIEAIAAFNGPHNVIKAEDIQVKLLRDVYSERQLQEVMIDFWLNHFNVYMNKSQQAPYYIATYERRAIRPYALGRFEDLLISTATSPAMLNYLDNSESVGPHSAYATGGNEGFGRGFRPQFAQQKKDTGLNENYAREVMELHTVGVNGGYTQQDVTELAKVFTGWTVGHPAYEDVPSVAQYDPAKHEPGSKVVLGHKIKDDGQQEGIEVLRMLAASPQCAKFISTKLAVRFVSDTPPPAMVERMTQTFLETHGDIRQVILAMVNSPEFFTAATYRAKLKTPQDFVVSAVRAAGSEVDSTSGMQTAIADLGMPLYGMQTPNGYSMKADAWNSTSQLVSRMNFAMALATNRIAGMNTIPDVLLGDDAQSMDPQEKTQRLEAVLLHDPVSARTQQLILGQVSVDNDQQVAELQQVSTIQNRKDPLHPGGGAQSAGQWTTQDPQAALATGLILGSPEFQRR
jgi:uncharacterized protein (DUF1800 family)